MANFGMRGAQTICLLFAWLFTVATGEIFFIGDLKGRRNNGVSVPAGDHFADASLDELW